MTPSRKGLDEEGLAPRWEGRFPYNEIISLLDVNRTFNLAESTSQDLTVGELMDLAGFGSIRNLKLGYGTSTGAAALREVIAGVAKQLAERSGFSQQYLSDLERGKRNPTIVSLYELAQALGVPYLDLLRPPRAKAAGVRRQPPR
jgi:transcriptional regulator with XRE-family HTH domain